MAVRFPAPLRPGDRIGVTSPSSGVSPAMRPRLEAGIAAVEERGYDVVVGSCMDGSTHLSAPAAERAAELMSMLLDPSIRAVVPPWGGETGIDLVDRLDWDALRAAEPTWLVGYSDLATLMTPLTLLAGVATVHGNNLMDTPYRPPTGLLSWLDVVALPTGATFEQRSPRRYRAEGWDDWRAVPGVRELTLNDVGRWRRLDGTGAGAVRVEGRLIGGCIETLGNLAGTPYLDVRPLAADGTIVYVEAAEHDAATICRNLHGMRLAGFFSGARAVLIGRTRAPDLPTLTQHAAVLDALGGLGVPLIADVECGHVPPYLPLVNGAYAQVTATETANSIVQTLQ